MEYLKININKGWNMEEEYSENSEDDIGNGDLLIDCLSTTTITNVKRIFENGPRLGLTQSEFKSEIIVKYDLPISTDDFELMFVKMDCNKDKRVTWDELLSFLLVELKWKEEESKERVLVNLPIEDLPLVRRSQHRRPIVNIAFWPGIRQDRSVDDEVGKYVTVSKDGSVNLWTPDLQLLRSFMDSSPPASQARTWIIHLTCLPNLSMVCTSSNERELRFYDMRTKTFTLRVVITSMPHCVQHMDYSFPDNDTDECTLACGDDGGNLRIITFLGQGPFKSKLGVSVQLFPWRDVVSGRVLHMRGLDFSRVHDDWVKQVSCYKLLKSVVSCSTSPNAMFIGNYKNIRTSYKFHLSSGIEKLAVNEHFPMVVTGSRNGALRVWNPFLVSQPTALLSGHQACIVGIFFQEGGKHFISLDKTRVVKVWDNTNMTCVQTYMGFVRDNKNLKDTCAYYNTGNHLLIVAGTTIEAVVVGKKVEEAYTDGASHTGRVSVVLYNRLYRCVLTCCVDSTVVLWNLWTNSPRASIKLAHSTMVFGEVEPVPITAATFDPPHQFLCTGASDGTVKVWNIDLGTCLKIMDIGKGCEVTKIIWLQRKILCLGWNHKVVEFSDRLVGESFQGKNWQLRHKDDIFAADYRPGETLATCTHDGDLIMWRLETGQSYKRFNAMFPTRMYNLEHMNDSSNQSPRRTDRGHEGFRRRRSTIRAEPRRRTMYPHAETHPKTTLTDEHEYEGAVCSVLFLRSRQTLPDQVTFLTALHNGTIQAWSHHHEGGFIAAFRAVHNKHDFVSCMGTDPHNEFLFTGTCNGYIKIWLLKNYGLSRGNKADVCMPKYRLMFPFLINDRLLLRAKRAVKEQPLPVLLSSYRGHNAGILDLEYLDENKILLTASADRTVRVWTLSGKYIGTLGQTKPWISLKHDMDPEVMNAPSMFRIPPDLQRSASSTTMKVWRGAPPLPPRKHHVEVNLLLTKEERKNGVYGKPLQEPYLGLRHKMSSGDHHITTTRPLAPSAGGSGFSVFTRLHIPSWEEVRRPPTPDSVIASRKRPDYESLYEVQIDAEY